MTKQKYARINREQQEAVLVKYKRSPDGAISYKEFRKRVTYGFCGSINLLWCGMHVCIEADGYAHT